jgi:hypothetical protein
VPVTDYTPVLADVGAVAATRTKDKYGNVTGTFSADTTPTNTIVSGLIEDAVEKVSIRIGDDIPEGLWSDAKDVVALRTAMLIESTYFPEQMQNARSPYQVLKTQYDEDLMNLVNSIYHVSTGGSLNDPPTPNSPRGSFPDATPWLERQM